MSNNNDVLSLLNTLIQCDKIHFLYSPTEITMQVISSINVSVQALGRNMSVGGCASLI